LKGNQENQLLDRVLAEITSTLGFKRVECLEYAHLREGATGYLSFPSRKDPRGYVAFSCIVAIRIEALAHWSDDEDTTALATFGTPIQFLRENKNFTEWTFSNASDLEALRNDILSNLISYAIPFIERFSNFSNLRKAVESPNPKDWIDLGVNQDSRVGVLALFQLLDGNKAGAMKTFDDALAERTSALPKRRLYIEHLRKQLIKTV